VQSPLSLCLFVPDSIARKLESIFQGDRYQLSCFHDRDAFRAFLEDKPDHIDCLVVMDETDSLPVLNRLYEQGRLLPIILLSPHPSALETPSNDKPTIVYHNAEIHLPESQWSELPVVVDKAIAHYLHLGPSLSLTNNVIPDDLKESKDDSPQSFLLLQQRRLADKLKERLGYLGVYYKRNPSHFYRNLSPQEKSEYLALLSAEYREIILVYFNQESDVNDMLDQFVNQAFFADLAISQILEIHMELMDEFSQHLKLEGRSEEVLLDYRLVLIDILAHLGEMYRRSIPREDIPFDVYYQTD
jgi:circadian clock protein KaiA